MNIILKGKIMPEPLHISSVFFYIFLQKRSIPFFLQKNTMYIKIDVKFYLWTYWQKNPVEI